MLELEVSVGHDGQLLDAVLDGLHLRRDHAQHLDGDAVELVEAAPRARLRQTLVDVADRAVIHLLPCEVKREGGERKRESEQVSKGLREKVCG